MPRALEGFYVQSRDVPNSSLDSKGARLGAPALLLLLVFLFLAVHPAGALDRTRQISQYGHTAWRMEDGVFAGTPNTITQTTDGYLWIGTQTGLMRFDGVRFVSWKPPEGTELPSTRINSLLGARDGSLWIGTALGGLARWRNGELTSYKDASGSIMSILEEGRGSIWIARANFSDGKGPLCRVTDTGVRCYGSDDGIPIPNGQTLTSDSLGNIWLGGGTQVSRWQSGSTDTYVSPGLNPAEIFNGVFALAGRPDGSLWVGLVHPGKGGGLQQLARGTWKPFVTSGFDGSMLQVTALLVDRDNSLWVGTLNRGIYRIEENNVDHFGSSDGLSGDAVIRLFEDCEGNIWIATSRGIDKFNNLRIASFSTRQGLSADQVNSVLAARDGSIWLGNDSLDVLRSGKISSIRARNGLPGHTVTSLLEDRAGRLWVGVDEELSVYERGNFRKIEIHDGRPIGAVRAMAEGTDGSIWAVTSGPANMDKLRYRLFRVQDLRIREEISSPQLPPTNTIAADPNGGVWLGLRSGRLARYRNGQIEFFSLNESPHEVPVHGLLVNSDGSVLVATHSGVVEWQKNRIQRLTVRNGLPCDVVYGLISDSKATLWLYAACGLIAIPNQELQRWRESPDAALKFRLFDAFDGAQPMSTVFRPNATLSPDGRLWFANQNIVQMIDPDHLETNRIVPSVLVEEVIADHKNYAPRIGFRLPSLTRDLEIRYTALSFVAPQKVRFRYKLEGHDSEWQDPGARRGAFYTDLRPGNYRFRVIACNNDGVWNEEGASFAFSLAPAWYQTSWFGALCVAAVLALLWALYRLRVRQLRRQQRKLRDVIETIPTFAWTALPDGFVDFANRKWQEYTGLSVGKTAGSGWEIAVHPSDLKRHLEKWRVSIATGETFEDEVRYRRAADGQYRWFLARAVPLRDAHGRIQKWYGTSTDIEDRKHAQKLEADLAHVNRVSILGELAASLSHELKQPIAATITNASTSLRWLKRDEPDLDEMRHAQERIVRDGARAADIIDRLRALYKKSPPHRELLDVNEVIDEMVRLMQGEAHRCAVSIRTHLAGDLHKTMADRVQVQQVLMNLMLNGIEAMKETGGVMTIKTESEQGGQVLISVSDIGVGLPADNTEQIFDAFYTTKPQGSGMGLSISRSIVESHGGHLWATPNSGHGATFHFTLPTAAGVAKVPAAEA